MDSKEESVAEYIPKAALVVAHPDDEILWAGGTILMHPDWNWWIGALCRGSDTDREPKFISCLQQLGAGGRIADLDDGPDQRPLPLEDVEEAVLSVLDGRKFDVLITHSPFGEYTRHRRHEETAKAVVSLWKKCELETNQLWLFAYSDGGKKHPPEPIKGAHRHTRLSERVWIEKYTIITHIYGFQPNSFEARSVTKAEAFWVFVDPKEVDIWLSTKGTHYESTRSV